MKKVLITMCALAIIIFTNTRIQNVSAFDSVSGDVPVHRVHLSDDDVEFKVESNQQVKVKFKYGNTYNFRIDKFDFYIVEDDIRSGRLIVADTLKDKENKTIAVISQYNEGANEYLSIQYYSEKDNVFITSNFKITNEVRDIILTKAISINMSEENEITKRIKSSLNIYNAISDYNDEVEEEMNKITLSTTMMLTAGTCSVFPEGYYDSYTDADGILNNYVDNYLGDSHDNPNYITDDSIVDIVPKELFFEEGSHFYIGKEYGFYVYTRIDSINPNDYAVDVLVFDITTQTPVELGVDKDWGSVEVEVLFNYRYRAVDKVRRGGMWDGYDPSLDQVVFLHIHYDQSDLYLKDVSFIHSILSIDDPNYADEDYILYEDHGNFITEGEYSFSATGLKRYNGAFTLDDLVIMIGMVPHPITSAISGIYFGPGAIQNMFLQYDQQTFENNNSAIVQDFNNTFEDQVADIEDGGYETLVKAIRYEKTSGSGDIPIHGVGHYILSEYKIAREGTQKNNSRYITSIDAIVGRDDSYIMLFFIQMGDFTVLDGDEGTYSKDYIYTVDEPDLSVVNVINDTITIRVTNAINNVGNLAVYLENYDTTPDQLIGYVDTGSYIEYTFNGLSGNTSYTFYSKFVDERNGNSSTVSSITVQTEVDYEKPIVSLWSRSTSSLTFKVTNVSNSDEALLLFAELGDSTPDNNISTLFSGDSYYVTFSGLSSNTYYTFYALFKDENYIIVTSTTSLTVKTLYGGC